MDAVFTLNALPPGTSPLSVDYSTEDDSATAGSDYVAASGVVNFPTGSSAQALTVTVNGDTAYEAGGEAFYVRLSNPVNAILLDDLAQGTIQEDETPPPTPTPTPPPPPTFSINDVTVTEGDSGTQAAVFTVTKGNGSAPASVEYRTEEGSAHEDCDYVAASGVVGFGTSSTQTVSIPVIGDTSAETNEVFSVRLHNPSVGIISDDRGQCTIVDNDRFPPIAALVSPSSGAILSGSAVAVQAQLVQGSVADVSSVEFQIHRGISWDPLGNLTAGVNPDASAPYLVTWNTLAEPEGTVDLRAVLLRRDASLVPSVTTTISIDHLNPDTISGVNEDGNSEIQSIIEADEESNLDVGNPDDDVSASVDFPQGAVVESTTAVVELLPVSQFEADLPLEAVSQTVVGVRISLGSGQSILNASIAITVSYPTRMTMDLWTKPISWRKICSSRF